MARCEWGQHRWEQDPEDGGEVCAVCGYGRIYLMDARIKELEAQQAASTRQQQEGRANGQAIEG